MRQSHQEYSNCTFCIRFYDLRDFGRWEHALRRGLAEE
jgi:hypothetical protein